jgi:hypothetical protein
MTLCSPLGRHQELGRTWCLHLQDSCVPGEDMVRRQVARKVITQTHGRGRADRNSDQENSSFRTTIKFRSCDRNTVILKRAVFLFITSIGLHLVLSPRHLLWVWATVFVGTCLYNETTSSSSYTLQRGRWRQKQWHPSWKQHCVMTKITVCANIMDLCFSQQRLWRVLSSGV